MQSLDDFSSNYIILQDTKEHAFPHYTLCPGNILRTFHFL